VQKQRANVYLMMLILSFLAIVTGCVFMYLEMKVYDLKMKPDLVQSSRPVSVQVAHSDRTEGGGSGFCA
jgi:hypothetical protein